jgi:hypothetical protein
MREPTEPLQLRAFILRRNNWRYVSRRFAIGLGTARRDGLNLWNDDQRRTPVLCLIPLLKCSNPSRSRLSSESVQSVSLPIRERQRISPRPHVRSRRASKGSLLFRKEVKQK